MVDKFLIYSLGTLAFILSGIFCSAVRWFHMCPPYDENPDKHFPGRKTFSITMLTGTLLMSYVLWPQSRDAWTVVRCYGFLIVPLLWLFNFIPFFSVEEEKSRKMRKRLILISLLPALFVLGLCAFSYIPGDNLSRHSDILLLISAISGFILLLITIRMMSFLKKRIDDYNAANFSNEQDFPVNFAKQLVLHPVVYYIITWAASVSDSRTAVFCVMTGAAVYHVWILIKILPPHFSIAVSQGLTQGEDKSSPRRASSNISSGRLDEICEIITSKVEGEEKFRDPHINVKDIARMTGLKQYEVSTAIAERLGGFYHYINKYRLAYTDKYQKQHPEATHDEVALAAGFGSRQSMYRASENIESHKVPRDFEGLEKLIGLWIAEGGPYEKKVNLYYASKTIGTNRTYLSEYLNEVLHMQFSEWIAKLRIEKAKILLLKDTDAKISDIGDAAGFTSSSNFIQTFSRLEDISPGVWRKHRMEAEAGSEKDSQ